MSALIEFLTSIGNFILNQIQSVVWVMEAIPQFVDFMMDYFAYCPPFLLVFLQVSLSVTVLLAVFKLL